MTYETSNWNRLVNLIKTGTKTNKKQCLSFGDSQDYTPLVIFGMHARAPVNNNVILLQMQAQPENVYGIETSPLNKKFKDTDVALFNPYNKGYIKLGKDSTITINDTFTIKANGDINSTGELVINDMFTVNKNGNVTIKGNVTITGDLNTTGDVTIKGDLDSTGNITNNTKNIGSTHMHDAGLLLLGNQGTPVTGFTSIPK